MSGSASIAVNLACIVVLLRDRPEALDEHAVAFRALDAAMGDAPLRLQVSDAGLSVNSDSVAAMPGAPELAELLRAHGIGELDVPAQSDGVLLSVLRAIAVPDDTYSSLLAFIDSLDTGTRAAISVQPPGQPENAALLGNDLLVPEPAAPAEAEAESESRSQPARREIAGEWDPASQVGFQASDTPQRLDEVLARLEADPGNAIVSDWLNEVVTGAERLVQARDWDGVVRVGSVLLKCEHAVAGQAAVRAYPIALRRILSRPVLSEVGRLVVSGSDPEAVKAVLHRMGADATEALLAHLAEAETIEERRTYYNALREMTEGATLFVSMLGHDEWYVVRNVADLCGDLRLEEAVPQLARRMGHTDERVRRSVATALAKIGTAATVEPIRQALRDPAASVRLQAVRGLDGWRSRGLAMTLSVLLDEETHPEIVREMMLALGRIGTPEALQTLGRAAAPGGRLFSRKSSSGRLAAIEGLRTAGPVASAILQTLITDDEPEVRTAAGHALAHVTEQD